MVELKLVKIDEIELCLELLKKNSPEDIHNATYQQIADLIQANFGVVCKEEDISLLHEPTIDQDMLSVEIHYRAMGFI